MTLTSNASVIFFFFFFNQPAPTEIYTLSLHDALPILRAARRNAERRLTDMDAARERAHAAPLRVDEGDRKSTRLNSSHVSISYAVFCLKKKKTKKKTTKIDQTRARTSSSQAARGQGRS